MENEPAIKIEHLSFTYKSQKEHSLDDISLEIPKGTFTLLCGSTGSGKTTLIRALNSLIPHFYSGTYYGYVYIENQDALEAGPSNIAKYLGTVFQNPENQLFAMDVERELAFGLENLGLPRELIIKRINNAFDMVKINHLRHRTPFDLSGGEQQKVAIASVLALDPPVLILDEPLANLDPYSAQEIVKLLNDLHKIYKKTIVIAEHRMEYLFDYIDRLMVLDHGKLLEFGSPLEVLSNHKIFSLGLDLPPIIQWFHNYYTKFPKETSSKESVQDCFIPIKYSEQKKRLSMIIQDLIQIRKKNYENKVDQKDNISYDLNQQDLSDNFKSGLKNDQRVRVFFNKKNNNPIMSIRSIVYDYQSLSLENKKNNLTNEKQSFNTYNGIDNRLRTLNNSRRKFDSIFNKRLHTVDNISISFMTGEIIGIVGPNGAGKSTLMRIFNGLRRPSRGEYWLKDHKVADNEPVHILSRIVGLTFQNPDHQLFANNVREELEFSLRNLGISHEEMNNRIKSTCRSLNICEFLDRSPFNLSGGQKKKVALGTILCRNPEILIFDEPTVGQDAQQKEELKKIILSYHRKGALILIISHDMEFLFSISTRIIGISQGKLMFDGNLHQLIKNDWILGKLFLKLPDTYRIVKDLKEEFPELFRFENIITLDDIKFKN